MRTPPKISAAIGIVVISMVAALVPSAAVRADDGMLPNAIVVNGRGFGHGGGARLVWRQRQRVAGELAFKQVHRLDHGGADFLAAGELYA